jgi:hypothetical protein
VCWAATQIFRFFSTTLTEQYQVSASIGTAIPIFARGIAAFFTLGYGHCVSSEVYVHSFIKHVERTFPKRLISLALAIANNSTINLVDLFETVVDHDRTKDLASNTTCAVSDHRLVLYVVILATLDFSYKVVGGLTIRNASVLELTDFSLKSISAIKEDDFVASFSY